MSIKVDNYKSISLHIDESELGLASWIDNDGKPTSVINARSGSMSWQTSLDVEKSEALIDLLHLHIANIKDNELELLALQTKVAA